MGITTALSVILLPIIGVSIILFWFERAMLPVASAGQGREGTVLLWVGTPLTITINNNNNAISYLNHRVETTTPVRYPTSYLQ